MSNPASTIVPTTMAPPKGADWSEAISVFLKGLDDYRPTVPEALSQYYSQCAGLSADDPRVVKFLSLAADKFLAEIVYDARQFSLARQKGNIIKATAGKRKASTAEVSISKSDIFEMEDLCRSLETRKIYIRRKIGVTSELKYVANAHG